MKSPFSNEIFKHSGVTLGAELVRWLLEWVPGFVGMWMGDEKIEDIKCGGAYLINLDSKKGGGTHWTGLYITEDGKDGLFFDPIGLWPTASITKSLKEKGVNLISSDSRHQNPKDTDDQTCGQRTCIALYQMVHSPDPKKYFMNCLSSD